MKRNLGMPLILSALVLTLAACGTDKMAANDSGSNAATGQSSSNTAGTSGATYSENASKSGTTTTPNTTLDGNTAGTLHGSGAAVAGNSPSSARQQKRDMSSAPLARQLGEDNRHGKETDERSSFDAAERDKSVDSVSMKTRYQLMLDNARVRDTDGFLFDGENASHDTL